MKRTCTIRVPDDCRVVELRENTPRWSTSSQTSKSDNDNGGVWSSRLQVAKEKLDIEPYHSHWKHFKEYTNKYERVFSPSPNRCVGSSVSLYIPVSRSYFKLWEMIHDFKLFDGVSKTDSVATAHLAEGPGGFIEAVCNYRQQTNKDGVIRQQDRYYGMTLIDHQNKEVPDWSKASKLLHQFPQIKLCVGNDGTGDLYKIQNIQSLVNEVGEQSCDLVTGDGGIDYSHDYSKQEELSHRLLVAQIYAGMLLVKHTKHFICKLFDTNQLFTKQMIWLLSVHFDTVHLVKPLTSRVANSERYVVACGFRGLSGCIRNYLRDLLYEWDANNTIRSIMTNPLPTEFTEAVFKYNEWHSAQQYNSLQKCYRLIDEATRHKKSSKHKNNKKHHTVLSQIIQQQDSFAREWCIKYNIPTNTRK